MAKNSWRPPLKVHDVQKIEFDGPRMVLTVDGRVYHVELAAVSKRLAVAGEAAQRAFNISPSGYGVHWAAIDEDLTIDGLIASSRSECTQEKQEAFMLKEEPPK